MRLFTYSLVVALFASLSYGEVLRLGRYYSDDMVLQRDKPNVIRGWADPGAEVHVTFAGQKATGKANDLGEWDVTLSPMSLETKGQTLTVSSSMVKKDVSIDNVVVGDVIFFGRQTTVDISLGRDESGKNAAAAYEKDSRFRTIQILTVPAGKLQHDLVGEATTGWSIVDANVAESMSAAAFYLGSDLVGQVDAPVGVVDLNMGYHFPISWLSRDALLQTSQAGRAEGMEKEYHAFLYKEPFGKHKKIITENPIEDPLYPAAGYNAVIAPLRGVRFKGAITQLGNDYPYMHYEKAKADGKLNDRELMNDIYVKTYEIRKTGFRMESDLMIEIPTDLRNAFEEDSLPFAYVIPPASELWTYAVHNREMRELQRLASKDKDGVDLILPGMDSVPFSGQPRDEKVLAERCASWVLGALYDDADKIATGPVLDRVESDGLTATVFFKDGTATGLAAKEGALDAFEVANVDAEYVPAKAVIDGETIRVTCDDISRIFYVRYNWKEHPDQGLVNAAGLPAIPFRTEQAGHYWFIQHADDDLPTEYSTPANEWKSGAVTLINAQLERIGYPHFSGWLGPIGIKTGPFGPNMGVSEVKPGSPAAGKLFIGDMIYSVNGQMLGEEEEMTMSAAITEAEATDGTLVFGIHRDGKNLDVDVQLEVLGRYSATSPWDCLKSEKIVRNLEEYLAARGGPSGFLDTDAMFLLGAGSPEYQWIVRKTAANMNGGGNNWALGYAAQYLSEYYLSTGDKRVLPNIQKLVDQIEAMQIQEDNKRNGGWYGRDVTPRSYPAMAHTGISAMLGLTLARECGVEVDEETFARGMAYLERKGAPMGQIIYGDAFRDTPRNIDPSQLLAGRLTTENGKVPEAAVLYELLGDRRSSHLNSHISTHAWYSTYGGHGGHFWDQYWTPLGSAVHSKEAYIYFMKGHRWFREVNRMFDGSLITGGKGSDAAPGLALVVPRRRLRILGAPKSPFSPDAPVELQDALSAYFARDYERAIELALQLVEGKKVENAEVATVEKLAEESRRMLDGIASDLARMDSLISSGQLYEADLMLSSLTPVIAEDDPRVAAISEKLKNGTARENDKELYVAALRAGVSQDAESEATSADDLKRMEEEKAATAAAAAPTRTWESLTSTVFFPRNKNSTPDPGYASEDESTPWSIRILETRDNAPKGWEMPGFDDAGWAKVKQPVSWHLNHTALHRATFTVDDPSKYDLLKFQSFVFRQQDVAIYLNGTLIGRINNIEKKTGTIENEFKAAAVNALKKGENTIAIATRQNWRWGMLSMRVYNNGGFDFRLFGRLANDE